MQTPMDVYTRKELVAVMEKMQSIDEDLHKSKLGCVCSSNGLCAYHAHIANLLANAIIAVQQSIQTIDKGEQP